MNNKIKKERTRSQFNISYHLALNSLFAGIIIISLAVFFIGGFNEYDFINELKLKRELVGLFVDKHRFLAVILCCFFYALICALSLPVSVFMSVACGFIFGWFTGGLISVFGGVLGATGVFLIARMILKDLFELGIMTRIQSALSRVESRLGHDSFKYLLIMRLIPIFPFWLVNLAPAFFDVPIKVYVSATLIGIIPGAFIYTTLGEGLANSLETNNSINHTIIYEPRIIFPLIGCSVLLLLPTLYRKYKKVKIRVTS